MEVEEEGGGEERPVVAVAVGVRGGTWRGEAGVRASAGSDASPPPTSLLIAFDGGEERR